MSDRRGSELLRASVTAESDGGKRAVRTSKGWVGDLPTTAEADGGVVTLYDWTAANEVVDAVQPLGLGWSLTRDADSMEAGFNRALAERLRDSALSLPEGIELLVSPEIKALIRPPTAITASFEIEENPHQPDWFDLQMTLTADDIDLTDAELRELLVADGKVVRLKSGRWMHAKRQGFDPLDSAAERLVILPRLSPDDVESFILDQLDQAGLAHSVFTPEALALIVRSGEGLLRRTRNLCLSALLEAVRDQTRCADLKQVNRVLLQPHWRRDADQPIATA